MEAVKIEIQNLRLKPAQTEQEAYQQIGMIKKVMAWNNLGLRYIGG